MYDLQELTMSAQTAQTSFAVTTGDLTGDSSEWGSSSEPIVMKRKMITSRKYHLQIKDKIKSNKSGCGTKLKKEKRR